eukprot:COSAG01_NODE_4948_length_4597_cov_3.418853_6_plen_61_part_00
MRCSTRRRSGVERSVAMHHGTTGLADWRTDCRQAGRQADRPTHAPHAPHARLVHLRGRSR